MADANRMDYLQAQKGRWGLGREEGWSLQATSTSEENMATERVCRSSFSRRELIRLASLSGLALAGTGVIGERSFAALAASPLDSTPADFLTNAYAQRAQAMTTGDITLLDDLYDPGNAPLLTFERARVSYFHNVLGAQWEGVILRYASSISLLSFAQTGSAAVARLYEVTT